MISSRLMSRRPLPPARADADRTRVGEQPIGEDVGHPRLPCGRGDSPTGLDGDLGREADCCRVTDPQLSLCDGQLLAQLHRLIP